MGDGEAPVLRREMATLHARLDEVQTMIMSLKEMLEGKNAENARLKARLAHYEAPGMPTSQSLLYNAKRAAFRKSRVEDPVGSHGDKKKSGEGNRTAREGEKKDTQ